MSFLQDALAVILVLGGTFFMLVGSIGINRLPDFFTRAHAAGKVDTLGILMFLTGLAVFEGFTLTAAKLLLIIIFVAFTSPVATHALARRALLYGMKPWYGNRKD
ncbi:multisubunit sodium/proton antiporter, MrpG subunit [Desulfonatronum thiosulfatophilum]|uniref:Multisubunit sodium/proton antiporter, MrpG subunit n=1 Tax=Desulfonatronum thiosulfatophilum TaxID=617002 RepID=A0A1G6EN58_9BACT|nr:monovalent cation/H(+) antiporter subunit G [Desulfonatronum thiosulfatophilum]SDB58830.1 multisubunit sodium/proton antiporter, MrpG subunit [Desulfonatronum thiosulfatophilum]